MSETLTAGSLFSGIGGLDLAASCAGFDIIFQVEIDDYCRRVLAKHAQQYWPNARQYSDVKSVGRHNLESVDCLFGSSRQSVRGLRRQVLKARGDQNEH